MTITGNGQEFFTIQQAGIESALAHGTPVAATKMLVGVAPRIISDSKPEFIEEQFNIRMASRRNKVFERIYMNTISTPVAGFQQLILPHLTGLKGAVVPTETTPDQNDYSWPFTPGLTVAAGDNAPDSFSLELGDEQQAWRVPYCMTDRITLKGKVSQDGGAAPVSLEQSVFGRYIKENAFTAALPLQASTPMNAKLAQLWVDNTWAGVGGTELTDALDEFTLEILTGVHPIFRGSAATADVQGEIPNYFNKHREGIVGYTASFVVEHALRDELLASQQAGELQIVRFKLSGPQIGTGESHSYIVDMGGAWEDVTPRDNADRGDNLSTLALHAMYDTVGAKGLEVTLVTDQNTI